MKRKFLSILLTLAMALTLLPTAAMAEGDEAPAGEGAGSAPVEAPAETKVAQIGSTGYASLAAAVANAENGDTITLTDNIKVEDTLVVTKTLTLDLAGHTLSNDEDIWSDDNWSLISIRENGNLTITGNGTLKAKENDCYPVDVQDVGAQLTIENGTFIGNIHAVYVQTGAAYIKGGTYSVQQKYPDTSKADEFVLNCYDASRATGVAKIIVSGGSFVGFNPANCYAEGKGTNFCAEGYTAEQKDTTYTVVEGENAAVANAGANYNTLADAINAVPKDVDECTITMLKDVTEDVTIPKGKTITLDLNGKKLTAATGCAIANKGNLTVVGAGTVQANGSDSAAIGNFPDAEVTLKGGNYLSKSWYVLKNLGTMTIDGEVTVKPSDSGNVSSLIDNGWYGNASNDMNQSYPTSAVEVKLTIKNGSFKGSSGEKSCSVVKNDDYGVLDISGGTFDSTTNTNASNAATIMNWNVATISGGTFKGQYPISNGNCSDTADKGELTVTGGKFEGTSFMFGQNGGAHANKGFVKISGGEFVVPTLNGTGMTYKVSVTGGYFTSDPTAYLAADKGLVTSDQSAFAYKVGDRDTDVKTAVTAGEATVTIPAGVAGITENTVKNAAKAADTTKTLTDTVAASGMTNDPAVVGTEAAAKVALSAENISVNNGETVTVVVQPYLEVNVKSAVAGKLTLEISAKYSVVATTSNPATIDSAKTVTLKSGVPLSINKPIELTIALPTGFAEANSSIYVQHKGYEYTATVDAYGKTATFINPHGFSTFTVTSTASAIAEVDGTSYTDLQKAVDAVANNGTITLLNDTSASAVVSRAVKFTLDKNSKSFTGAITAGSGYNLSVDGGVYTFTVRSSSGSSSGSSSSSRRYDVSAPSVKHGDVTVSPKSASKGDTVTITVKPDSGYELDTLTVKDASGSKIKVKDKGDGKFTFTMPASKVTVSAEFAEIETLDFADVSTDAYYYEAVKWAAKKGITGGTGDGTFNPNGSCTRAHIVAFLWRAAGSPEPKSTVSFADVPAGSYYAKAVAWAVENGITLGTGDGTFSPNATCTRAQSVTFLYRALGTAPTTVNGFTDVTADAFYADAVAWAVESGVTNGTSASTFSPNNGCTRAQIVTFLYRAYQGK